jgi:hypothetical protein
MGCLGKIAAVPRIARVAPGAMLSHVLNRGGSRSRGGRGLVRFSASSLCFQRRSQAENTDLSPSFPPRERLHRGATRMKISRKDEDLEAFRRVVEQTLRVAPMRICAYCWMPNHWHSVLRPKRDGNVSKFMQRMPPLKFYGEATGVQVPFDSRPCNRSQGTVPVFAARLIWHREHL